MAKDSVTQTPTRRSKRFQPLIEFPVCISEISDSTSCAWLGKPRQTRQTQSEDLWEDEQDRWDQDVPTQTSFYDAFNRSTPLVQVRRRKNKVKGKPLDAQTYKIGDTVLVSTSASLPSVAVIVSMWETKQIIGGRKSRGYSVMRVKVHWFLRPTELAGVRAKRDHVENEIYYSLSSSAVLSASQIICHCTISSEPPPLAEAKSTLAWSISSNKRPRAIPNGGSTDVEDEQFYCHLAVDSKRGLFYGLQWETHRTEALLNEKSESDWGSGHAWDVTIDEHVCKSPKKKRELVEDVEEKHVDGRADKLRLDEKLTRPRKKRKVVEDVEGEHLDVRADELNVDEEMRTPRKRRNVAPVEEYSDDGRDEFHPPDSADNSDEELPALSSSNRKSPLFSEPDDPPQTPSKKRRRSATTVTPRKSKLPNNTTTPSTSMTPRRPGRTLALPTPHSKAAIRARARKKAGVKTKALLVRPPEGNYNKQLQSHQINLPADPWLRAMHELHVAAQPDALPCREEEFVRILRAVEELLEEGSGGCVYISGVPGSGKTATVHAVVRELKRMAEKNEANPFTYVEINGLKIPEPSAAYGLLWESISGHNVASEGHLKISAKESLKQLTRHFSAGARAGPGGHACVVLMDELDQLMTATQDVVYNFFNWPMLAGSKLVVLAVANTMDLPERVMTGRVRSRLGMVRINFQPYTTQQLEKIVHARLQSAKEGQSDSVSDVITQDGVKFAAMKVSSISGDARRVLDICRRTVELVQPRRRVARTDDVKNVIKVMQNSPTAAYLKECSLHERIMLAALLKCIKREGVEEIKWGQVKYQHVIYTSVLPGKDEPSRKPTHTELSLVLDSLLASRAILMENGLSVSRKPEDDRRILLNLDQGEVERVLSEEGGQRWKNVLNT